jgi:hypothetical protein
LDSPAGAVLVIEVNGSVTNFFTTRHGGGVSEVDLLEFAEEMQKAYSVTGTGLVPTNKECAFAAHMVASEFRMHGDNASNPLQQKQFYTEARKYEDVCDRFLKGLSINQVDLSGDIIAYYVKGDGGYAYSLNSSANSCTCHAGRNSTEICWHMRAVECFLTVKKNNERN